MHQYDVRAMGFPKHALEPATRAQSRLKERCMMHRVINTADIHHIAGADAAYSQDTVFAAIVVMTFPDLRYVERATAVARTAFPYIPGLFAFREAPALVKAYRNVKKKPDLVIINGHGYAHPRRFGIASHTGVLLDIPSIGVARSLLVGSSDPLGESKGSVARVMDGDELIGMAVRSRDNTKPIFISAGHKTDLPQALDIVVSSLAGYRFPEPLRLADICARHLKAKSTTEM
jgi:deoxyribonuclease V